MRIGDFLNSILPGGGGGGVSAAAFSAKGTTLFDAAAPFGPAAIPQMSITASLSPKVLVVFSWGMKVGGATASYIVRLRRDGSVIRTYQKVFSPDAALEAVQEEVTTLDEAIPAGSHTWDVTLEVLLGSISNGAAGPTAVDYRELIVIGFS